MGVFEVSKFEGGTRALMDVVTEATKKGITTVIGKQTSCSFLYHLISEAVYLHMTDYCWVSVLSSEIGDYLYEIFT